MKAALLAGRQPTVDEPPEVASQVAAWWATDLVGVIADEATVTAWIDRSGTYTLTPNATPTFEAGDPDLNNRPAVDFDDNDYLRVANTLTTSTSGCVVAVVVLDLLTANRAVWATARESVTTQYLTGLGYAGDGHGVIQRNADTADWVTGTTNAVTDIGLILEWSSTGSAYELRRNNVVESKSVTSGADNGDWFGDVSSRTAFELGAVRRSDTIYPFNGRIAYCMVANAQLSSGDRTALYGFLTSYYGI